MPYPLTYGSPSSNVTYSLTWAESTDGTGPLADIAQPYVIGQMGSAWLTTPFLWRLPAEFGPLIASDPYRQFTLNSDFNITDRNNVFHSLSLSTDLSAISFPSPGNCNLLSQTGQLVLTSSSYQKCVYLLLNNGTIAWLTGMIDASAGFPVQINVSRWRGPGDPEFSSVMGDPAHSAVGTSLNLQVDNQATVPYYVYVTAGPIGNIPPIQGTSTTVTFSTSRATGTPSLLNVQASERWVCGLPISDQNYKQTVTWEPAFFDASSSVYTVQLQAAPSGVSTAVEAPPVTAFDLNGTFQFTPATLTSRARVTFTVDMSSFTTACGAGLSIGSSYVVYVSTTMSRLTFSSASTDGVSAPSIVQAASPPSMVLGALQIVSPAAGE